MLEGLLFRSLLSLFCTQSVKLPMAGTMSILSTIIPQWPTQVTEHSLNDEPSPHMTDNPCRSLKNLSLTPDSAHSKSFFCFLIKSRSWNPWGNIKVPSLAFQNLTSIYVFTISVPPTLTRISQTWQHWELKPDKILSYGLPSELQDGDLHYWLCSMPSAWLPCVTKMFRCWQMSPGSPSPPLRWHHSSHSQSPHQLLQLQLQDAPGLPKSDLPT